MSRASVFARKVLCAVLPRQVQLRRRLVDGTIVGGLNRSGYGGRGVFIFGIEAEPELAILDELLSEGQTLVDVGANTGVYTLRGARAVGESGQVVALEPNPLMLAALAENVSRNGYSNVRLRGLGVSNTRAELSFYENFGKPNSFSLVRVDDSSSRFSILVTDLDSLLEWEGIKHVDLIKIDAEGVEDLVIAGAAGIIERSKPAIIAEFVHGGLTAIPDEYVAYGISGSPNRFLLPRGHAWIELVERKGWHRHGPVAS